MGIGSSITSCLTRWEVNGYVEDVVSSSWIQAVRGGDEGVESEFVVVPDVEMEAELVGKVNIVIAIVLVMPDVVIEMELEVILTINDVVDLLVMEVK